MGCWHSSVLPSLRNPSRSLFGHRRFAGLCASTWIARHVWPSALPGNVVCHDLNTFPSYTDWGSSTQVHRETTEEKKERIWRFETLWTISTRLYVVPRFRGLKSGARYDPSAMAFATHTMLRSPTWYTTRWERFDRFSSRLTPGVMEWKAKIIEALAALVWAMISWTKPEPLNKGDREALSVLVGHKAK